MKPLVFIFLSLLAFGCGNAQHYRENPRNLAYTTLYHLGPRTSHYLKKQNYKIVIDQSTNRILIKDEQTKEGLAFSYLSGEGYYIDANVSADILDSLDMVWYPEIKWADFKAAGIPFRIDNYGATGCCQPITFLKKFNIIFFDSHQPFSLSKWMSTVSSLVNRNYANIDTDDPL